MVVAAIATGVAVLVLLGTSLGVTLYHATMQRNHGPNHDYPEETP